MALSWNQEADLEEGNLSDFNSTNGSPAASAGAALNGSYGMACAAALDYGVLTGPSSETGVTVEWRMDPNSLAMSSGANLRAMAAADASLNQAVNVLMYWEAGAYQLRVRLYNDTAESYRTYVEISDGPHLCRLVWKASSGAGNDDGFFLLFVDGLLVDYGFGLDNDTKVIDRIEYGWGFTNGTVTGTLYTDDCRWHRGIAWQDLQALATALTQRGIRINMPVAAAGIGNAPAGMFKEIYPRVLQVGEDKRWLVFANKGEGDLANADVETVPGTVHMGENEVLRFSGRWGFLAELESVDLTVMEGEKDVTSAVTSGSDAFGGKTVSYRKIGPLTGGKRYTVLFQATDSGDQVHERALEIVCEHNWERGGNRKSGTMWIAPARIGQGSGELMRYTVLWLILSEIAEADLTVYDEAKDVTAEVTQDSDAINGAQVMSRALCNLSEQHVYVAVCKVTDEDGQVHERKVEVVTP